MIVAFLDVIVEYADILIDRYEIRICTSEYRRDLGSNDIDGAQYVFELVFPGFYRHRHDTRAISDRFSETLVKIARYLTLLRIGYCLIRLHLTRPLDLTEQRNKLIFSELQNLGGVYVKFLQLLAVNFDFMRTWAGPREMAVFEQVSYEPIDIQTQLGDNLRKSLKTIDSHPFAAGSFGQVYRGALYDGTNVAIKVLRPSVEANLRSDLRVLRILSLVLKPFMASSTINITAAFKEFEQISLQETDYIREAANTQWFYDYFTDIQSVVIPVVYMELSSKTLLVTELIDGVSLASMLSVANTSWSPATLTQHYVGSDLWKQLETLGSELLIGTLRADYIFADPHPGNIFLLPNNKIALVDFGIIAKAPTDRHTFLGIIREYHKLYNDQFDAATFTAAGLAFYDQPLSEALRVASQSLRPETNFMDTIGGAGAQIVNWNSNDEVLRGYMKRRQMFQIMDQVINRGNRFGISIDIENANLQKAMLTYMSMVGGIARKNDEDDGRLMAVRNALGSAIAYADTHGLSRSRTTHKPPSTDEALELLSNWLGGIADRDPGLYRQLAGSIRL